MLTIFQKTASLLKFSPKFLLIATIIFSTVILLQAQTLEAFNPNANVAVDDIEPLPDGKIMICGQFTTIGGQNRRAIARLNADGTLDPTFAAIDPAFQNILDMIVQPDGKILISGGFSSINGTTRIRVARLNTDGTLDTNFDAGLTAPVGVSRMALQPDGKVLIPANFSSGGFTSVTVLRKNSNGSADTSFGSRSFNGGIAQLVLQPDGKVLAVGAFTTVDDLPHRNIVRLNANGSLDSTFNSAINNGTVFLMMLAPDGKIYASGNFTTVGGQSRSYFARLNSDGTLDTSFQDPQAFAATNGAVRPSILLPDGKILIAGSFDTVGGVARKQLARLNSNGTLDPNFRNMQVGIDSFNSPQVIKRQPDGKILIGGTFTTIDGQTRNRIARIIIDDEGTTMAGTVLDFDGDGKSDFAVTRAADASSPSTWYITNSGGAPINSFVQFGTGVRGFGFVNATDVASPGDFDGDGKTDIAVFRPNGLGDPSRSYFFILESGNNVFRSEQFGAQGDNPTIIDDYDGDGKADVAVYREGATAGAQSFWFYRPSASPTVNFHTLPWGIRGDFVAPGDYDGDGTTDICIYRPLINGTGQFILNRSSDGTIEFVNWGLGTDQINPGDYDGDGKTDFMVTRNVNGGILWYLLTRTGTMSTQQFGTFSTDYTAQGDYDGDGKTDIAVWRNAASGFFYVQRSSAGFQAFQWGLQGDYPIAYYNAH